MRSIILAGGKGTRLRPLTVYTPKPIVPFINRPFLLYQIDLLRKSGITDITLSLNYQPDKIEHLLGNGTEYGVDLQYITEPSPMGTGGAYKYSSGQRRETTVVFNGDILTDTDISSVIRFHQQKKAAATVVLTPVANPSAYGLVETSAASRVEKFLEKPKTEDVGKLSTNNINAGIYILEPEVLDLIPEGKNFSFEYDVFPRLLERNMNFFAFIINENYWRDIGTLDSYLQAHHDFLDGKIRGIQIENSTRIVADGIDDKSVFGEFCVVKTNARIINSIIGDGVHIEEKAHVENSVIWSRTRINSGAEIKNAIVGKGCFIGRNSSVSAGTVLGDKSSLTDYTSV